MKLALIGTGGIVKESLNVLELLPQIERLWMYTTKVDTKRKVIQCT